MTALSLSTLQERVSGSELGKGWIYDPLMQQDIWPLTGLGYSVEQCRIKGSQNVDFSRISLPWLKLLAKLTVRARVRERHSLDQISTDVGCLSQLDAFLIDQGHIQPITITDALLQTFIAERNKGPRHKTLVFATRLWAEEDWLVLPFIPLRTKRAIPQVKIIPEEVLHQVYEHLELFPAPLERMFRLQIALGCRLNEMLTLPRNCLKQEGEQWFLLRWVAKRQHWRYYEIHPLIKELVQEQQRFLDAQFGAGSAFNKLFCKASTACKDGAEAGGRFKSKPIYQPSYLSTSTVYEWLQAFSEIADLRDKYGKRFQLTSHMFRRTKASVMAYCEAEDEYIAAVLGHGSLDMLPHYRTRSLERLEKEAKTKGYIDMYGRISTYKPRKQRYEKLADLVEFITTALGKCFRPVMLGDCQARYACWGCEHHWITEEDREKLEADRNQLQCDLQKAQAADQQRRVTEIERLLELANNRLKGLDEFQALVKEVNHETA